MHAKAPAPKTQRSGLHWEEGRARFHPVEYVATTALFPLAIGEYFAFPAQSQPHWTGGIGFDEAARDALRVHTPDGLRAVWTLADGTGVFLVALSVGLDSVIVPLVRGSSDVAWQLMAMDAEAFTLSSLVAITLYDTIGRARPPYEDCVRNDGAVPSVECNGSLTASFPSGHINEAFTAAGLSCAHHMFAHVYGNRIADAFGCGRDLALATIEGVLRIAGDRHYVSDVFIGSAIGFTFGFAMPTLLHYVKWPRRGPVSALWPSPILGPDRAGLVLGGSF
jgi:membrane-associated phospholipid phosphatase